MDKMDNIYPVNTVYVHIKHIKPTILWLVSYSNKNNKNDKYQCRDKENVDYTIVYRIE